MEGRPNISFRFLHFVAHTNIFIGVCAAFMTAYTLAYFQKNVSVVLVGITLGTTFIMYNTQQLLLEFLVLNGRDEYRRWFKAKRLVLILMLLVGLIEIYPLFTSGKEFLITYASAAVISFLYFLPFSNLRSLPLVKSIIIGIVWTLVCVIAPLGISEPDQTKIYFGTSQFLFITALCILFNIRDVEHDKRSKTHTLPVLYGLRVARIAAIIFLGGYLLFSFLADGSVRYMTVHTTTFILAGVFTLKSDPNRHPFYFLLGVDGIVIVQAALGFIFL